MATAPEDRRTSRIYRQSSARLQTRPGRSVTAELLFNNNSQTVRQPFRRWDAHLANAIVLTKSLRSTYASQHVEVRVRGNLFLDASRSKRLSANGSRRLVTEL
jgi:hypothetical protein